MESSVFDLLDYGSDIHSENETQRTCDCWQIICQFYWTIKYVWNKCIIEFFFQWPDYEILVNLANLNGWEFTWYSSFFSFRVRVLKIFIIQGPQLHEISVLLHSFYIHLENKQLPHCATKYEYHSAANVALLYRICNQILERNLNQIAKGHYFCASIAVWWYIK